MVLGVDRGHPGVISSDTHLLGKHTQEHVLRGGELVLMLGFLKHEAGVRLQAHRERFGAFGAAYAKAMALLVRDLGPTHVLMVAGFLRHEIRGVVLERVGAPHTELGMLAILVGLLRTSAEETQV